MDFFSSVWPGQKQEKGLSQSEGDSKAEEHSLVSLASIGELKEETSAQSTGGENLMNQLGCNDNFSDDGHVSESQAKGLRREEWMKDSDVSNCYICERQFKLFNRRHHCRKCGRVFCGRCSKKSVPTRYLGSRAQRTKSEASEPRERVCDDCYKELLGLPQNFASLSGFQQSWRADMLYVNGSVRGHNWNKAEEEQSASESQTEVGVILDKKEDAPTETNEQKKDVDIPEESGSRSEGEEEEDDEEEELTVNEDEEKLLTLSEAADKSRPLQEGATKLERRKQIKQRKRELLNLKRQERQARKARQEQLLLSMTQRGSGGEEERATNGTKAEGSTAYSSDNNVEEKQGRRGGLKSQAESETGEEEDTDSGLSKHYRINWEGDRSSSYGDADTSNVMLWIPPPAKCEDDEEALTLVVDEGAEEVEVEEEESEGSEGSGIALQAMVDGHFRLLVEQLLQNEGLHQQEGEVERSPWLDIVCELAVQAAILVKPDTKESVMDPGEYVEVKRVASGSRKDSRVVDGVVCRKNVANRRMESDIKKPNLLLLGGSLEYHRTENQLSSMETLINQQQKHLNYAVDQIERKFAHGSASRAEEHRNNCNVLLVEKSVAGYAQENLVTKKISLVYNLKQKTLEKIARCTGGQIASSIGSLSSLGRCKHFYTRRFTEEHNSDPSKKPSFRTLMFFEGCPQPLGCTVLLMGASREELKKVKKVVELAVFAAYHLALETSFLADEGAIPQGNELASEQKEPPSVGPREGNVPPSGFEWPSEGKIAMLSASLKRNGAVGQPPKPPVDLWSQAAAEKARKQQSQEAGVNSSSGSCLGHKAEEGKFSAPAGPGQEILVSGSSRCLPKKMVCESPKPKRITYYGDNDMPLARFFLDFLFNKENRCKSCEKPTECHIRVYTHREGSLTISMRKVDPPLPGTDDHIWLWHRCKRCVKSDGGLAPSTARVIMSQSARNLSFGKFLELSFATHAAASRVAACGHSLHRECLRFYGCQDLIACFSYAPMKLHTVHLPPRVLKFNSKEEQQWLMREHREIVNKKEAFVSQVQNSFQSLNDILVDSPPFPSMNFLSTAKVNIASEEKLFQEEKDNIEAKLTSLQSSEVTSPGNGHGQHTMDILTLNSVRREIAGKVGNWEKRLSILKQEIGKQKKQALASLSASASTSPAEGGKEEAEVRDTEEGMPPRAQSTRETVAVQFPEGIPVLRALSVGHLPLFRDLGQIVTVIGGQEKELEGKRDQEDGVETFGEEVKDHDGVECEVILDSRVESEAEKKWDRMAASPKVVLEDCVKINEEASEAVPVGSNEGVEERQKPESELDWRKEREREAHREEEVAPSISPVFSSTRSSLLPSRQPSENGPPELIFSLDPDRLGAPGFVWTSGLVQLSEGKARVDNKHHNDNNDTENGDGGGNLHLPQRQQSESEAEKFSSEGPLKSGFGRAFSASPPSAASLSVPDSPTRGRHGEEEKERAKTTTPTTRPVGGTFGLPPLSSTAKMFHEGGPHLNLPLGVSERVVPIYEDEPTSFIAFALSTEDYQQAVWGDNNEGEREVGEKAEKGEKGEGPWDDSQSDGVGSLAKGKVKGKVKAASPGEGSSRGGDEEMLLSSSQLHVKVQIPKEETAKKKSSPSPPHSPSPSSSSPQFSVTCYYAKQFEALRSLCCGGEEGHLEFVRSLCRCKKWEAQGGKSTVYFAKTLDDRFVVKQVQRKEMAAFLDFARDYFKYMSFSFTQGNPSCLAKILGLFQITIKGTSMNLIVTENLLYDRKVSCIYDLKGSIRSRYNSNVSDPNAVLLDENLLETMPIAPIFVAQSTKKLLERAVWNDTKFLADMDVMDYSMLVGIEEESQDLFVGIIDFIRPYTWDKQLENWVKASGILGGPKNTAPTIISPDLYKTRFRKAMKTYFVVVPEQQCEVTNGGGLTPSLGIGRGIGVPSQQVQKNVLSSQQVVTEDEKKVNHPERNK